MARTKRSLRLRHCVNLAVLRRRRVPSLSVDLVHLVSLHVELACVLTAMSCTSKEWRAAVTNASWCHVTILRFPRVPAIVKALNCVTPLYRDVYRDQLACIVPAAAAPPSSIDERLRAFVFTLEFSLEGALGETPLWSWTGYLQSTVEGLDDDGWVDGIGCRLWTENDRPQWATKYLEGSEVGLGFKQTLTVRILVTKMDGKCIRTRILAHLVPYSILSNGFSLVEPFNSSTRDDFFMEKPLVYRDDLPGGTRDYAGSSIRDYPKATIRGFARPHLDVVRGVFEGLFVDVNKDAWSPDEAVDFLNRFVVW